MRRSLLFMYQLTNMRLQHKTQVLPTSYTFHDNLWYHLSFSDDQFQESISLQFQVSEKMDSKKRSLIRLEKSLLSHLKKK